MISLFASITSGLVGSAVTRLRWPVLGDVSLGLPPASYV